jgi:hypothetical protein
MNPIPWYRSPVLVGALVSVITQLLALLGVADVFSEESVRTIVSGFLEFGALIAALVALWKRWRSKVQPITLTKAGADGQAKSPIAVALVLAVMLLGMLAGCGGTRALYSQAHTPVQYAKAVLVHHNALGQQVLDLRADPLVSEESKGALLEAYRATVCDRQELDAGVDTGSCRNGPSWQLDAAAQAYEQARNATTETELQEAVDQLVDLLTRLISAVNAAR